MRRGGFTPKDVRYAHHIVGSLARHRATRASSVLSLLHPNVSLHLALLSGAARASSVLGSLQVAHPDEAEALLRWLEPLVVNLAGAMRLESAVPLLVERLYADNLNVNDEAITALIGINTDAVVRVIADQWKDADAGFRASASNVLEHIHSDLCAETCLTIFAAEQDPDTKLSLAHAVLSQLVEEGIEPVRRLVLGHDEDLTPDGLDIRYRFVVACTMMGTSFPEQNKWYGDAVANNWGLGGYRPA
jgi:HEAT repeat protein